MDLAAGHGERDRQVPSEPEARGPNIFSLATKELSQDAFVAWLAKWADPVYRDVDPRMHEAGKLFLGQLFSLHDIALPATIDSVEVKLQWKAVDVIIKVNGKFLLLIEDKTSSSEHSDQLKRYLELCHRHFSSPWTILPVYLKTGDQGSSRALQSIPSGFTCWYKPFYRADFLNYFEAAGDLGDRHPLFVDFRLHLEAWERRVGRWRTLPHARWRWSQWVGFYQELRSALQEWKGHGEWHYVSNRQGGFLLFGLSREHWREGPNQLALRIASVWAKGAAEGEKPSRSRIEFVVREPVKDTAKQRQTRKHYAALLQEIARRKQLKIETPRSRAGKWMRFGEFDYLVDENPVVDKVLQEIRLCQEVMEQVHQELRRTVG